MPIKSLRFSDGTAENNENGFEHVQGIESGSHATTNVNSLDIEEEENEEIEHYDGNEITEDNMQENDENNNDQHLLDKHDVEQESSSIMHTIHGVVSDIETNPVFNDHILDNSNNATHATTISITQNENNSAKVTNFPSSALNEHCETMQVHLRLRPLSNAERRVAGDHPPVIIQENAQTVRVVAPEVCLFYSHICIFLICFIIFTNIIYICIFSLFF